MYATIGLQVSIEPEIKYEGFGGNFWWGPSVGGSLGPGPPAPPLKSGPDMADRVVA